MDDRARILMLAVAGFGCGGDSDNDEPTAGTFGTSSAEASDTQGVNATAWETGGTSGTQTATTTMTGVGSSAEDGSSETGDPGTPPGGRCLGAGSGRRPPPGLPSWFADAPEMTWIAVPATNTFLDVDPMLQFPDWDYVQGPGADYHSGVVNAWNSAVWRKDFMVFGLSGGHWASQQNAIYEFGPFSSETPGWHWFGTDQDKYDEPSHTGEPDFDPSTPPIADWNNEVDSCPYSDGLPCSRHTYGHVTYIPELGGDPEPGRRLIAPVALAAFGSGGHQDRDFTSVRFASESDVGACYETHDPAEDMPAPDGPMKFTSGIEWDPGAERAWFPVPLQGPDLDLFSYNPHTKRWCDNADGSPGTCPHGTAQSGSTYSMGTIDPVRRIMAQHWQMPQGVRLVVFDLDLQGEVGGTVGDSILIEAGPNYSGPAEFFAMSANAIGMAYEPVGGKIVGYDGGDRLYVLQVPPTYRVGGDMGALNAAAEPWEWIEVCIEDGSATPPAQMATGTFGKFGYIDSIGALCAFNHAEDESVYCYKVPAGGL